MDDGLKQRLVGAGVLCAVAVILLPSFFQRTERRVLDRTTLIPSKPEVAPVAVVEAEPPEDTEVLLENPETLFNPDPEQDVASPEPEPAGLTDDGLVKGWVLQVASFAEQERAAEVEKLLQEMGYKAFVSSVKTPAGVRYRVNVGPHVDKSRTESVKQVVDTALSVNSLVLTYQP